MVTPDGVKTLLENGHKVTVERFADRCFADADYAAAGATLVDTDRYVYT
jgi:alanine dehydrogenase